MAAMVTGEVQKQHIYIFLTAKILKLKVRKFDHLSSSRSGDIEKKLQGGGHNAYGSGLKIKNILDHGSI